MRCFLNHCASKRMFAGVLSGQYAISMYNKALILVLSLVTSIILARLMSPQERGNYAAIINLISILSVMICIGLPQSFSYWYKLNGLSAVNDHIRLLVTVCAFIALIGGFLSFLFGQVVVAFVVVISATYSISILLTQIHLVIDSNSRKLYDVISSVIFLVSLVVFINASWDKYWGALFAFCLRVSFDIVFYFIFSRRVRLLPYVVNPKRILKTAAIPFISSIVMILNYKADIVIMSKISNSEEMGYYSLAVTIANIAWLIPDAFKDVMFGKAVKNENITSIRKIIGVNIVISLFSVIFFVLLGKYFINTLYGHEYLPCYSTTVILIIAVIPMVFYKILNVIYITNGCNKFIILVSILTTLLNICANCLLVPQNGAKGAAISSLLSYSFCGLAYLFDYILKEKRVTIYGVHKA